MKKGKKSVIICVILMIIMTNVITIKTDNITLASANQSSEIVMEKDSLRVLYKANENKKLPIASTTKIVTAITVIENAKLSDKVEITKESVGVEGSSIYLKVGDVCTVEELLYGLMMRSGNDAACALALHVGKTIDNFAKMMNELATKCGARNSRFTNPHGLHNDNHYSTAYDLAVISCYALKNETFKKIVSTKKITINSHTFINKNKMLFRYFGANGIKTGFTKKAGRCLVTGAEKNGMQLVSVVLNCPSMYERSEELLNESFDKFNLTTLLDKGAKAGEVSLIDCPYPLKKYDVILDNPLTLPLSETERRKARIVFEPISFLNYPVDHGKLLGNLRVFVDKDLIFSLKLFNIYSDNTLSYGEALYGVFARWGFYENQ